MFRDVGLTQLRLVILYQESENEDVSQLPAWPRSRASWRPFSADVANPVKPLV